MEKTQKEFDRRDGVFAISAWFLSGYITSGILHIAHAHLIEFKDLSFFVRIVIFIVLLLLVMRLLLSADEIISRFSKGKVSREKVNNILFYVYTFGVSAMFGTTICSRFLYQLLLTVLIFAVLLCIALCDPKPLIKLFKRK